MDKYAAVMVAKAKASGVNAAELAKTTAYMAKMKEWYKNPLFVILMTYAEILPLALIVSLITSLILKRKLKPAI